MEDEKTRGPIKLQIDVPPEVAAGRYANVTMVNHTETEFVLDFIFLQPQAPKAQVGNRVIVSPKNAKRLLFVLTQNLKKYEERFGEIEIAEPPRKDLDILQ
jgi:hypothetical protein